MVSFVGYQLKSLLYILQILANMDIKAWKQLDADYGVVTSWLTKRSAGDILSQVRNANRNDDLPSLILIFEKHAIQLNTAQRGLEMQQAIQRLSSEELEDINDDKKAQADLMLNSIKDGYKTLNNFSEDDSLFDPECVGGARFREGRRLIFS